MAQVGWDPNDPYHAIWAPAWRIVADPNDPERSRWQAFTGQSGHVASPHYDDLQPRWARGEMQPMAGEGPWRELDAAPAMPVSRRDQIKLTEDEQRELLESERVVDRLEQRPARLAALDAALVHARATARSGSGPTPSRRRSATSSATRGRRCWSRPGPSTPSCAGSRSRPRPRSIRDLEAVFEFAKELTIRYAEGIDSIEGDAAAALQAQAAKRVAIRFRAGADRDLGPPQARRHLLACSPAWSRSRG